MPPSGLAEALRLMGANPVKIKQWAFGIATAVLGIAGALLIIVAPVEPTLDRSYIGRTFCVVVMAGLGSMTGTLVAAIILVARKRQALLGDRPGDAIFAALENLVVVVGPGIGGLLLLTGRPVISVAINAASFAVAAAMV